MTVGEATAIILGPHPGDELDNARWNRAWRVKRREVGLHGCPWCPFTADECATLRRGGDICCNGCGHLGSAS
jgi:hypothetical protein